MESYNNKKERVLKDFSEVLKTGKRIVLQKSTISNLFRYRDRKKGDSISIQLSDFNNVISIDKENKAFEVEGLATYESIVNYCLKFNLLPLVTPELKSITIGGAIVGIGIESTCYKYGFVHDGLIEADVLTPNGKIITCNKVKNKDLFYSLGNSYGTFGYVLRAKIKLHDVKPYVHIRNIRYDNIKSFIEAMHDATKDKEVEFIESLLFSKNELYLMLSKSVQFLTQKIFTEVKFFIS